MSDNTFQINEVNKPTEKASDLNFAAPALQVGASEMKAMAAGPTNTVEAAGFTPAEHLLAGLQSEQTANKQPEAASKQELLAQFQKDYKESTSPQMIKELEQKYPFKSAEDVKQFLDKRVAGQEQALSNMTDGALQLVGSLADAIKNHDSAKLADILKDTPADITNKIAFAVQYELQTQGVNNLKIESQFDGGRLSLDVVDTKTRTVTKFDEQTGVSTGPRPLEYNNIQAQ